MADPLVLAIATAAAGKAVEVAGEPVKDGVAALCRMVRGRFGEGTADEEVLSGAIAGSDDRAQVGRLAEVLRRVMEEDPVFAREVEAVFQGAVDQDPEFRGGVEARVRQMRVDATANDSGVSNVFTGTAEKVVQVRDVHGGFIIN